MFPKISFWLLLHLAVLLAVVLAQSSRRGTYQEFVRRHIEPRPPTTNLDAYCNRMIVQKGLNRPYCPRTHIFIHQQARIVANVCRNEGTPVQGNMRDSRRPFRATYCQRISIPSRRRIRPSSCRYRGRRLTRRIRLFCRRRLPVRLAGLLRDRRPSSDVPAGSQKLDEIV